jgi:GST-like protein
LLNVMNQRLAHNRYLAGESYSIADIACYAWTLAATTYHAGIAPDAIPPMPHVRRWLDELGARPAVQRGMAVPDVSKA